MIIYQQSKIQFINECDTNVIAKNVSDSIRNKDV